MKLIDEEGIIKLRNLIKSDIQEVRDEIPDIPKDAYPIEGSHNPIESGGVYDALADKQDVLTFDNTPTANSENPVKSGGVYQVVTGKQDRLTFDEVPTLGSQNMVRSGAIALALNNKNDMATPVDTISSSVDNPVKSSAIYEALQGKQDTLTFDAVPTEGSGNVVSSNGIYEALSHAGGTPDWNQSDSDGVGYINNRTHYIEYTFSQKLIDVSTIDWNDSSTSTTIGGVSYKLIYTSSSNIPRELTTTGKFRVSFGNKYAIASSTFSSNAYRTAVEDLGLYIITTSSTVDVYVNWESPSQLLTIEKVTYETYHKLDNNYLDISTTPTSGSVKPISSGAVYTALQDTAGMPDWLQNDSTKKSYIKNRTHYSTYTWVQHFSATLDAFSSESVAHNGKTYYHRYTTSDSSYYLSFNSLHRIVYNNREWYGYYQATGINYIVYTFDASDIGVYITISYERDTYNINIYTDNFNSSTLTIYRATGETVYKLPTKYIDVCNSPQADDTRPITAKGVYDALQNISSPDWNQNARDGKGFIFGRTHYISNYSIYRELLNATVLSASDSTFTKTINGESYKQILYKTNVSTIINGNKCLIEFAGMSIIADFVKSSGQSYIIDVPDLGLYIEWFSACAVYSNWDSPSGQITIKLLSDVKYHKLDTNYLKVDTYPIDGSNSLISSGSVYHGLNLKEALENKVTVINESSTDDEYPSALAVWKLFNDLKRRIARLEAELGGGTSAIVEDNILEVFNGEENDNILELDDRSYVDENNILNFINSSSTASVDNNILTDDSISVDNGILNVPNATVDDSMIDLG